MIPSLHVLLLFFPELRFSIERKAERYYQSII